MVLDKKKVTPSWMENPALAKKKSVMGAKLANAELNRLNGEQTSELHVPDDVRDKLEGERQTTTDSDEEPVSEASGQTAHSAKISALGSQRNNECHYVKNSSVNMQDLRILLFTDGEIDIDKVLCLYLLTAHKTETLHLPPKLQRVGCNVRLQSPLERLIERSKARDVRSTIFKTLPLFLLEVPMLPPKQEPQRDPRLAGKVIVNTKILRIIHSVKTALDVCNTHLLRRFLYLAHDRARIENIMMQPKMSTFYRTLYGQNIISSCESFQLEATPKNSLSFRVDVEPLEELIRLIRGNILLIPNSKTWKECTKAVQNSPTGTDAADKSNPGPSSTSFSSTLPDSSVKTSSKCDADEAASAKEVRIQEPPLEIDSVNSKEIQEGGPYFLDIEQHASEEIDQRETIAALQPKILKNLQLGFSEIQLGDEEHVYTFDQNMPLEELAMLLEQKVQEEALADYQNLAEGLLPPRSDTMNLPKQAEEAPSACYAKMVTPCSSYHVRNTKCEACLGRWQQPLPTPKISKIKKFPMPQLDESSYYSSKSAQRISVLIDKQVQKFEVEEREAKARTREENLSYRQMQRLAKGNFVDQTIEIIDLDEMDLAKIRQEIKEIETAKKLKKFFESTHDTYKLHT